MCHMCNESPCSSKMCDVWSIVLCSRSQLALIDTDVTQITANKGIKGENKVHPQASND